MRREILGAGMAIALVGSAAACKKEADSSLNHSFTVAPNECGKINNDLAVCNKRTEYSLAVIYRIVDGNLRQIREGSDVNVIDVDIKEITKVEIEGLEGLELTLDKNFNLIVGVSEPLLSATAVPTSTPLPTPFEINPPPWNSGTA